MGAPRVASDRATAWALRVLWVALPLVAGPALSDALHGAKAPVRTLASLGLWASWATVVVAMLIPRPMGLTAVRVIVPAALATLVVTAFGAGSQPPIPGLVLTAIVAVLAMSPEVAAVFANGPAYPNERRFPLRVPAPLLVVLLPLSWALIVAGIAAGPLLLAAGRWISGGLSLLVGWPLAVLLLRSVHMLSRRWAVLVPAGLVLHDPMTLLDPVLFRRNLIEVLRPAPVDSDALDLTQRAPGLALELRLTEKVPMVLVKPGNRQGESGSSARLLFTPARPGALLAAAGQQRIPVQTG